MRKIGFAACLLPLLASPSGAAELASQYQDISAKSCRDMNPKPAAKRGDHEIVPFLCPAFRGYGVSYAIYPASQQLRIDPPGKTAPEPQVRFKFGLGEKIEWRGAAGPTGFSPQALIVRTGWSGGAKVQSVLNILRVEPGAVCLAAVVDASANKDANLLARRVADEVSAGFTCGKGQPKVMGVDTEAARDTLEGVI